MRGDNSQYHDVGYYSLRRLLRVHHRATPEITRGWCIAYIAIDLEHERDATTGGEAQNMFGEELY